MSFSSSVISHCAKLFRKENLLQIITAFFIIISAIFSSYIDGVILYVICAAYSIVMLALMWRIRKANLDIALLISPLLILLSTSVLMMVLAGNRPFHNAARDFYYVTQAIVYVCFGYIAAKVFNSFKVFFSIIACAGLVIVFINVIRFIGLFFTGNVKFANVRRNFLNGYQFVALSFFYAFDKVFQKNHRIFFIVITITLFANIVASFSRFPFIVIIPFIFIDSFKNLGWKKGWLLPLGLLALFILGLLFLYLVGSDYINEVFRKLFTSLQELNPFQNWTEQRKVLYWRGYESYASIMAFSNFSPLRMVFGEGLGYLIPIGVSDLNGTMVESIPITHNAYAWMLCKFGILGLFLYIAFFSQLLFRCRDRRSFRFVLTLALSIDFFFVCITNQGPLIASGEMPFLFAYGGLLFFVPLDYKNNARGVFTEIRVG